MASADVETSTQWVRRAIRAGRNENLDGEPTSVGELELAPFQAAAVQRGIGLARRWGGVLVADAVGLGKTRIGLGICEALARDARIRGRGGAVGLCVPARLRAQWSTASRRAQIEDARIVSHTELSRRSADWGTPEPSVVIVDEAHRFRNPRANRSEELAELAARATVVLLTATPVCNSIWDLYHLLSLFLAEDDLRGQVGWDLREAFDRAEASEAELAVDLTEIVEQVVVRRTHPPSESGFGRRPSTSLKTLPYEPGCAEAWIWGHLESALRDMTFEAMAESWPRQLFVEHMLRCWESGPHALHDTLERLLEYHRRWLEADANGRSLSRQRFRDLFGRGGGGMTQEVFPFLYDSEASSGEPEGVRADRAILEELVDRAASALEEGRGATDAIVDLIDDSERKVLVFTRYRRAARGLFKAVRERVGHRTGVGLVTGGGAEVTGLGRTSTDEALRRFAPGAQHHRLPTHQQLSVLVSTDCLSEGVNLQDCGCVVMADLPYSPLVVEQRIGRLLRPGGPHDRVDVYLPRPEGWTDTLGLRRNLRRKLGHARRTGTAFVAAESLDGDEEGGDEPAVRSDLVRGDLAEGSAETEASERLGAERMGEPIRQRDPLGAITKMDALARRLGPPEGEVFGEGEEPTLQRAVGPVLGRRLWVRWLRSPGSQADEEDSLGGWLLVSEDQLEARRSHLAGSLVALADAELQVESADFDDPLWERAMKWVRRRNAVLEAVRLAPSPLDLDAPQRRIWCRIRRAIEEEGLTIPDVDGFRDRLLRPTTRGLRRKLAELADSELQLEVVHRRACDLLARSRPESAEIRAVSGLLLEPRPGYGES
jgi:superfamily II DNA or RNA helicase